jgi:hypothetical protein
MMKREEEIAQRAVSNRKELESIKLRSRVASALLRDLMPRPIDNLGKHNTIETTPTPRLTL